MLTLLPQVDTSELRKHCEKRLALLKMKRQPWLDFTIKVGEELLPSRLPFLLNPQTTLKGGEQNTHIVDAVGHLSLDTVAAGITTGTMPVTSPWFGLLIRNDFSDDDEQRLFLDESGKRILAMHNQGNTNLVMPELHKEWVMCGMAAALLLEDDEDGFRLDPLTVGEYCVADDHRGRVDTLYRELTMTVGQLAEEFGVAALSPSSKTAYERQEFDLDVPCVHAIEPDRDGLSPYGDNKDLPWRSVYYELTANCTQVLAVRGFDRFPALVWRGSKLPGSAYANGRGHDVLPHLVRLRRLIYRYGQALAFKSEPPLQIPAGMQQHEVRTLAGQKTTVLGQQPIKTLFEVNLELGEVAEEIERTRQAIRETLGASLVAGLRAIKREMTAREADLRTSQDLNEFLPGLSRLTDELLNPYIEFLWDVAWRRGLLPQLPDSLRDQVIDIEFTSPLARKQSEAEVDAIVRTFAIAGEIAKVPQLAQVVDNFDVDDAIRRVSKILGAPATTLLPIERVRAMRDARANVQKAQADAAAAQQSVDIGKGVAETQRLAGAA